MYLSIITRTRIGILFVFFLTSCVWPIMKPVTLEYLVSNSRHIVKGDVTSIRYESSDKDGIITIVTLSVVEDLRGQLKSEKIEIRYPGGIVGDLGMWVEDTPSFEIAEKCLIFIEPDQQGGYSVKAWKQGKFRIVNETLFINNKLVTYQQVKNKVNDFLSSSTSGLIELQEDGLYGSNSALSSGGSTPSITSISTSITQAIRPRSYTPNDPFDPGERGRYISIIGSGFGSTRGSSVVEFFDEGSSYVASEVYSLWSDTYITCLVPGNQFTGGTFPAASSGPVRVVTTGGTSNSKQLDIEFIYPSKRFDNPSVAFYINQLGTPDASGEFTSIQSAMNTWSSVSSSEFDLVYSGTTSRLTNRTTQDNFNDLLWVESNWSSQFSSIAIAVNRIWFNGSSPSRTIFESDIFFNGENFTWSSTGEAGKMDVQNIATHELGHSINLQDLTCIIHKPCNCPKFDIKSS